MKTQHIDTHTLLKNPEAPRVAAINAPLSSLSDLDVAAQDLLEELRMKNSERTAKVLELVFLHPGGITTRMLRELTELDRTLLSPILTRLMRSGYIDRVAYGVYRRNPRTYAQPKIRLDAEDLIGSNSSPKPREEEPVSPRAKEPKALDPAGRALLDRLRRRYSTASMSILEYLFAADGPCTISEVVEATKLRRDTVSVFLARECRKDILEPVGRGVYQRSPRTYEEEFNLGL